VGKSQKQR